MSVVKNFCIDVISTHINLSEQVQTNKKFGKLNNKFVIELQYQKKQ